MTIELPEFATGAGNEAEPTPALKASGWADGDAPPAEIFNWLHRTTYEAIRRNTLAGQIRGIAHQSEGGEVATGSTATTDYGMAYDEATGTLIAVTRATISATPTLVIATSTDGGNTFTNRHTDATAIPDGVCVLSGGYAVVTADNSDYYHSSAPFTTWTKETSGYASAVDQAMALATIEGAPSAVAVDGYSVQFTPLNAAPTAAWVTTLDFNVSPFLMANLSSVASGNGYVVVAGDDDSSNAAIAYAADTAGGVHTDYTRVLVGSATSIRSIVFDGTNFVAVDSNYDVYWAPDPSGAWTAGSAPPGAATTAADQLMTNGRGLVVLYDNDPAGDTMYASADGGRTFVHAISITDNEIGSGSGPDGQKLAIDGNGNIYGFKNATIATCVRTMGG